MKIINRLYFYVAVLATFSNVHAKQLQVTVNADSAILMNAETGAILYEKDSHKLQYPASTTKIVTALLALKKKGDQLDTKIEADGDSIAIEKEEAIRRSNYTLPSYRLDEKSSHMGIKKGEILTFRDLLYGLMLVSADDASNIIANFVSGTIPQFVDEMNAYAKELGCVNSHFCNPHGMPHPKHQVTAYEMAIFAREALKNDTFREMSTTVRYTRPKTNKQEQTTLTQTNKLLKKGKFYYPKAIGIKTGYTSLALSNIVAAAQDGNRTLIAVLLRSKDRSDMFNDVIKLFEAAFQEKLVKKVLLKSGPQKFSKEIEGNTKPITTYLKEDVTIEYYPAELPPLKSELFWIPSALPIAKDQIVGEIRIQTKKGQILKSAPLYAQEDVQMTWTHWLKQLF